MNLKIFVQNLSSFGVQDIYFNWEESPPLLLECLFFFNIFIFKLKLLVQKLKTLAVIVFQIYRFSYSLCMGGATPTIANSPNFVKNIYIKTVVTCTTWVCILEVSCCYSFSNKHILLLAYNNRWYSICGRGTSPIWNFNISSL